MKTEVKKSDKRQELYNLAIEKYPVKERKNRVPNAKEQILKVLFKEKQRLSKQECVVQMTIDRMLIDHPTMTTEQLKTDKKLNELFKSTLKTCSNGFDTATCNGQNNAVFSYDPKYSDYELIKHEDRTYSIVKK